MSNKIVKTLVTMESLISLMGMINTYLSVSNYLELDLIVRIIMFLTGFLIITYMVYVFLLGFKVSNFITNNKLEYKISRKTSFVNQDDEKEWMFLQLSKKFPSLSFRRLNRLINKHYESIRHNE